MMTQTYQLLMLGEHRSTILWW